MPTATETKLTTEPKEKTKRQIVNGWMREIYVEADRNIPDAAALALSQLNGRGFEEELIRYALSKWMADIAHRERTLVKKDPEGFLPGAVTARTGAAIDGYFFSVWMMPNGKSLGECSVEELQEFASAQEVIGNGHHHNARFYRWLAEKCDESSTVSESVTEAEAAEKWQEISTKG